MPRLDGHAREYVVLLGLVCQGLVFERWYVPILLALAWMLARRTPRALARLGEALEALLLLGAFVAGYHLAENLGVVWFAGLSGALCLYQLLHLGPGTGHRERLYTVAVAITHIAVAAQAIFDYRFALIIAATVILLPIALAELEMERLDGRADGSWRALGLRRHAVLAALTCLFFVAFPRLRFGHAPSGFGVPQPSPQDDMDMAAPGTDAGEQLIFRVEGDDIGYLRTLALDRFDGRRWSASANMFKAQERMRRRPAKRSRHRRVTVFARRVLRNALPVDGHVTAMQGTYRQSAERLEHGGVMLPMPMRRAVTYEYWSLAEAPIESLAPRDRRRYLSHPPLSPGVADWFNQHVDGRGDPEQIVRALTETLRTDFTYSAAAPSLDDDAPLDDFLLRDRQGHCTRFASTLAVLLRSRGIPTRVVLGFVPRERNALGGFYNIRARHAHAWTDVWLEDKGWTMVDATPLGTGLEEEHQRLALTLYEWIEFVWYARIVGFGRTDQLRLSADVRGAAAAGFQALQRWWLPVLGAFLGTVLVRALIHRHRRLRPGPAERGPEQVSQRLMTHVYGRMLHILEHQGIRKRPALTPLEFAATEPILTHPGRSDIALVTQRFCAVRYGRRELPHEEEERLEAALRRIAGSPGA